MFQMNINFIQIFADKFAKNNEILKTNERLIQIVQKMILQSHVFLSIISLKLNPFFFSISIIRLFSSVCLLLNFQVSQKITIIPDFKGALMR